MSMITILFTVLRRSKAKENKLILLQNYSHILFLNKPEYLTSSRKGSMTSKQSADSTNIQNSDQNLNGLIKRMNTQPTKKDATATSLIDYGASDKSEEVITSRVNKSFFISQKFFFSNSSGTVIEQRGTL